MRKAISFFIIAVLIFILALSFTGMLGLQSTIFATIVSVIAGLVFIGNPRGSLDFYSFFPKAPVYLIELVVSALIWSGVAVVLILAIGFPLLIGYFIITLAGHTTIFWALFLIVFITILIMFRKKYVEFINKTIEGGVDLLNQASIPFKDVRAGVDAFFNQIYEWVKTED